MNSTIVNIREIGPVLFERSRRAKHVNISIKANTGIRVAVPSGISFQKAEKLIQSKISWIKKHQLKFKKAEKAHKVFFNDENIDIRAAKLLLTNKLTRLAGQYGFSINKITIRNQKTRWGSCSSLNNINLNIKLAKLPEELVDYVLFHELVHTKIKNHGQAFWAELDYYVGDAKKLDKKLKKIKLGFL
ncbi:DUF45 domain-containing protein [candidate division KSB1 bacterium]|nr:DUF45 domain-containing protein [candidate division KSB1 bacterium]